MGRPHYTTTAELNVWMEKRISELEEALTEIRDFGSSQPAALNVPDEDWERMRARQMQNIAYKALEGDGLREASEAEILLEKVEAELATARETNRRLNERCQIYEKAIAEKVKEHPGPSFGRALANAEAIRLSELLEAAEADRDRLREAVKHYQLCHDRYGRDDMKTGRAWNVMTRCLA